ncbi:MAG: hypothetical protein U5N85_04875 [Arcicella sp.]|nr:hypothetical protein [Arcicella sp.]
MNAFTLSNFKKIIPKNLIAEGERIYKLGNVKKIVSSDGRDWNADVTVDREVFNVEISIDLEKSITDHFCDCPSETEHCHHQAAALIKLKEILPNFTAGKTNKPKKKDEVVKKKKKSSSPVEAILDEVSMLELHAFIIKSAAENKVFKNLFMLYFADKNESNDRKYYGEILKSTIASIKRNGSLNKSETKKYIKVVEGLSATANDAVNTLKFKDFAPIALSFFETLVPHLKRLDDSEIKLTNIQRTNFTNFVLVAQRAPYEIRVTIIKELLEVIEPILTDLYNAYRFYGFIEMLREFGKIPELKDIFISFIERNLAKGNISNSFWAFSSSSGDTTLETEFIELAKTFYKENNSADKIPKLLAKHTHVAKYRKEYLEYLFDINDYQEVKKLLEKLLFRNEFSERNTYFDPFYLNKLDEVYEKLNDFEGKINALKLRFRLGEFKQFSVVEKIKKMTDKAQWDAIFESIKKDILDAHKAKYRNMFSSFQHPYENKIPVALGHLYVFDSRWDELDVMVKKNNDLESYGTFCEYLLLHNHENTFNTLKQKLQDYLKNPDYSQYANYANVIKALQGVDVETKEFTVQLLRNIKTYHSGKKKLLDELKNVGLI